MRKILALLLLLFVSLTRVHAQESHISYYYEGTTYRANNGSETSMTNKSSSCQLPTQFTLSILSGRKMAWMVSSSQTMRFEGNGVQYNGGYYFVEPASLEDVMGLYYDNFSMGPGLFVNKDYRKLIVVTEESSGSNGKYTRFDYYRSRGSVSAPTNPQRVEYEKRQAERVKNERIAQQEAAQRDREYADQAAQTKARMQATLNKPFPLANFRDTHGNMVESSYFCRGKKLLVITTMVGSMPNRQLKTELENYPQIASQIIYIHMVEGESTNRYKPNEPVSQNKIYFNVQDAVNQRWVFGTMCPRIILVDEQGRVMSYILGYRKDNAAELKALVDKMRVRTSAPYQVGDYYFDGQKEGVVFEVWDNGRSGKLVGLKKSEKIIRWEDYSSERINFDKEFGLLEADSKRAVMSVAQWYRLGRYPVFSWCFDYGVNMGYGWFLPSDDEWNEIWRNRSLIDRYLIDKIGTFSYWTCREKNEHDAYYVNSGSTFFDNKSVGCYVRAVTTFGSPLKKRRTKTSGPYKVGDYYSENGKRGLVFEVSEDGYSGKIVSLDFRETEWCTVENIPWVGAFSKFNGAENMEAIKQIPDWQTKFPAFNWCAGKGEEWYLPAEEELLTISRNKSLLNPELNCPLYLRHWSSTEGVIVDPYRNKSENWKKNERNQFRAVSTFGMKPIDKSIKEITSAPYQVGDYYFDGQKEGVVFEVWDEGRSGKILSLDRGIAPWMLESNGQKEHASVCQYETDGRKNMDVVKQIPDWQRNYPAMKWCADLGEGWCLPAIFELKQILLDSDVNSRLDATLRAKGYYGISVKVPDQVRYLSSTENFKSLRGMSVYWVKGDQIKSLSFREGEAKNCCYIRAVSTFGDVPRPTTTMIREKTSGPYFVGDYYNDGVKDGIVFEVSEGGMHGKIISMREPFDGRVWSLKYESGFGAKSKKSGRKNMDEVMAIPNWQTKFPAFAWCVELGEGWYLPSIEEWNIIYANLDKINLQLEDGFSFSYYWTSVLCPNNREEDNKEIKKSAYSYDFNCKSGEESVSLKTSKLGVRAIAQF